MRGVMHLAVLGTGLIWGVQAFPRWSWDTVQTFMHCANVTGEWNDAALDRMANMSYVTYVSYE